MIRISNNCWIVGDAPVEITYYMRGTHWEEVIDLYNKHVGYTVGMVGVFTLENKTITARSLPNDEWLYRRIGYEI